MKTKPVLIIGMLALLIILVISNVYFFRQNAVYKTVNRKLILQNDSLLSVTMYLEKNQEQ